MSWRVCDVPYNVDGEWCREFCNLYGTSRCRYDSVQRKMIVEEPEDTQEDSE